MTGSSDLSRLFSNFNRIFSSCYCFIPLILHFMSAKPVGVEIRFWLILPIPHDCIYYFKCQYSHVEANLSSYKFPVISLIPFVIFIAPPLCIWVPFTRKFACISVWSTSGLTEGSKLVLGGYRPWGGERTDERLCWWDIFGPLVSHNSRGLHINSTKRRDEQVNQNISKSRQIRILSALKQ